MSEGKKFDKGKCRMELIPSSLYRAVGWILTFGADIKHYGARNWEKGLAWSRPYGAILRHLTAWWEGETTDPESGYSHLWHAACELAFLIEYEKTHPELDDRPNNSNLYPAAKSTATGIAFIEGAEERFTYYADQLVRDRLRGQHDGFGHKVLPVGPDGGQSDDATGFVDSSGEPTESTPCLGSDHR